MRFRGAGAALIWAILLAPCVANAQDTLADLGELSRQAFELLNASRAEADLAPLRWDPSLSRLAVRHSRDQANRRRVSHHSYEFGLSTERRIHISFPHVPRLAENVARNRSVESLHEALLRSPGHRRNRMDPEFTHVGIGLARVDPYVLYLTEIFVTAPPHGTLDQPVAFYFDAAPGSYEQRDDPRVELAGQTIIVGPPGPDDPEHWTVIGINAYESGELAAAEEAFRTALALDPGYFFAQYNLARVLVDSGAAAAAVGLLDELLERDPGDLTALVTRGNAALLLEDFAAAEGYFRTVLSERPADAVSWYGLGLALEYQDRRADAEAAYRQALRADPTLRAAQVGLGRVMREPSSRHHTPGLLPSGYTLHASYRLAAGQATATLCRWESAKRY